MNNIRDAKALHLHHIIGNYEVIVETSYPHRAYFGFTNVSLESALRYAGCWGEYELIRIKCITIKEVANV